MSDLVFIGRISSIDTLDWKFEIEPLEVFKGKVEVEKIKSLSSACSHFPSKVGDLWLIYGTLNDQNTLFISECGLSRSFEAPFSRRTGSISIPPPPMPSDNIIENKLIEVSNTSKAKTRAIRILRKEISKLRKLSN